MARVEEAVDQLLALAWAAAMRDFQADSGVSSQSVERLSRRLDLDGPILRPVRNLSSLFTQLLARLQLCRPSVEAVLKHSDFNVAVVDLRFVVLVGIFKEAAWAPLDLFSSTVSAA
jgi:hypothetical protein